MNKIAAAVLNIVFGVLINPRMVGGCVVWHPVEPYLHTLIVGRGNEVFQIGKGSVVGINALIILHGIGAVDAFSPAWIDRHEPDNIYSQRLEPVKLCSSGSKGSFGGECSHVEFVNHIGSNANRCIISYGITAQGIVENLVLIATTILTYYHIGGMVAYLCDLKLIDIASGSGLTGKCHALSRPSCIAEIVTTVTIVVPEPDSIVSSYCHFIVHGMRSFIVNGARIGNRLRTQQRCTCVN